MANVRKELQDAAVYFEDMARRMEDLDALVREAEVGMLSLLRLITAMETIEDTISRIKVEDQHVKCYGRDDFYVRKSQVKLDQND